MIRPDAPMPSLSNEEPTRDFESNSSTAVGQMGTQPQDRWQRAKFFLQAVEVRLRFIGVFVAIGLMMAYWSTLEAYWDRWTRPVSTAVASDGDTEYYCPMHPNVIRPGLEPNGAVPSCPICGMPLSLRKKGEIPELPEGVLTRVQLSPERVQLAGVKTVPVSYMPLAQEVRTVGYVEYDEARLAEIVTRVGGYLEDLFIDKTFEHVDEGQPLAEIYSPDLYSSMQELLLAKKHNANDLIASARQRLKLLGVNEAEINEALAGDDAAARLVIRSSRSGQVIEKNVVKGASVEPGTVLFKVADLSTVWIEADLYERDLPFVQPGQEIEARVDALPGMTFSGEVALIYPELNTETRTNRIRVQVENPDLLLRPGMFATVFVRTPMSETEPFKSELAKSREKPRDATDATLISLQKVCPVTGLKLGSMGHPIKVQVDNESVFICCEGCRTPLLQSPAQYLAKIAPPPADGVLSVPEQAVIDTGSQKVVYVEREPGVFEGVEVKLGQRTGGYYPVIAGLTTTDRVAAAGSFLLDAETRLNPAAASAYFGASGTTESANEAGATTSTTKQSATKKAGELSSAQLDQIKRLSPEDQQLAIRQRECPVTGEPLGSMGVPVKVIIDGQPVFLCCAGCEMEARENSAETLKKVSESIGKEKSESAAPAEAAGHVH